jgi:hypothetical protein
LQRRQPPASADFIAVEAKRAMLGQRKDVVEMRRRRTAMDHDLNAPALLHSPKF